jgi:pyruvate,water dikinase
MILPLRSAEIVLENGGGKGANLSRLIRSGYPVPDGFVVTSQAYQAFVDQHGLADRIAKRLEHTQLDALDALEAASQEIRGWFLEGKLSAELEAQLFQAYMALGSPPVAVRSSATAEDLPELSFAGQQDTYLNITAPSALKDALLRCWSSLWTARAIGYRARNGIPYEGLALAVVVQRMVQSQASGVLFSANPLSGLRGQAVIDATFGLGEALVSGQVDPDQYIVQQDGSSPQPRILQKTLGGKGLAIHSLDAGGTQTIHADNRQVQALPDQQILALAELGWQVAGEFGSPQDIEWGWADGRLHLLQSRPITSLYPLPEGVPAEPLHVLLSFGGAQGMLDPMTPLGRDGIFLLVVGGARLTGFARTIESQHAFFEAGERLYINITPFLRNKLGRKVIRVAISIIESGSQQVLEELLDDPRLAPGKHPFSLRTTLKLAKLVIPIILRMLRTLLAPDASRKRFRKAADTLLAQIHIQAQRPVTLQQQLECIQNFYLVMPGLMIQQAVPCFAPGLAMLNLLNHLAADIPDGNRLALEVTRGLPYNVTTEMDLKLWEVARAIQADTQSVVYFQNRSAVSLAQDYQAGRLPQAAQRALLAFLEKYGVRGVAEIDVGRSRWREDPTPVMEAILSYLRIDDPSRAPNQAFARGAAVAEAALEQLVSQLRHQRYGWFKARLARFAAYRVRSLSGMREYPKFIAVNMMGILRRMLLKSGESLVNAGLLAQVQDIFFLHLRELESIAPFQNTDSAAGATAPAGWDVPAVNAQLDLKLLIAERQAHFAREKLRRQIPRLLLSDGRAFYEGVYTASGDEQGSLPGMAVSPGVVEGRVRVVFEPHKANLQPGEILVCPGTDPAWTPLFLAAGGLVMEVGGMMTHGSVVAREYGIPAVVGVSHATQLLQTGQMIRVNGNTGKIHILKED